MMRKRAMRQRKLKGSGKRLEKRIESLRRASKAMSDQAASALDSLKSSKAYHDARIEKEESAMRAEQIRRDAYKAFEEMQERLQREHIKNLLIHFSKHANAEERAEERAEESVAKVIDNTLRISNAKAAKPLSWLERLMLKFAVAKAFADGYAEDIPTMLREVRAAFGEINRA